MSQPTKGNQNAGASSSAATRQLNTNQMINQRVIEALTAVHGNNQGTADLQLWGLLPATRPASNKSAIELIDEALSLVEDTEDMLNFDFP